MSKLTLKSPSSQFQKQSPSQLNKQISPQDAVKQLAQLRDKPLKEFKESMISVITNIEVKNDHQPSNYDKPVGGSWGQQNKKGGEKSGKVDAIITRFNSKIGNRVNYKNDSSIDEFEYDQNPPRIEIKEQDQLQMEEDNEIQFFMTQKVQKNNKPSSMILQQELDRQFSNKRQDTNDLKIDGLGSRMQSQQFFPKNNLIGDRNKRNALMKGDTDSGTDTPDINQMINQNEFGDRRRMMTQLKSQQSLTGVQMGSPLMKKKLKQVEEYLAAENLTGSLGSLDFEDIREGAKQLEYDQIIDGFFQIKFSKNLDQDQSKQRVNKLLRQARALMKKGGVNYNKFKKDLRKTNPELFNNNILKNKISDPRFMKPYTLVEYERDENLKLYDSKNDSVIDPNNVSPSKMAQPRLSLNEIIAEKKQKEKRRFIINGPNERNKTVPEMFRVVEEAKKSLEDGTLSLQDCYQIMRSLQETVKAQDRTTSNMMRTAEDLLYDAKCQVAIGDEDPKDANPQFSLKAFKQHIKKKEEREQELRSKKNSRKARIQQSSDNQQSNQAGKSKKRMEMGGVKVERDTNKDEIELLKMFDQQHQNSQFGFTGGSTMNFSKQNKLPEATATTQNLQSNKTNEEDNDEITQDDAEKQHDKIVQEFKYQMFKQKMQEKDTHNYFISKENQQMKPSYMFPRKNSYLEFINQTVKKSAGENRRTAQKLRLFSPQQSDNIHAYSSIKSPYNFSAQKSALNIKGIEGMISEKSTQQIQNMTRLRPQFKDVSLIHAKAFTPVVVNLKSITKGMGLSKLSSPLNLKETSHPSHKRTSSNQSIQLLVMPEDSKEENFSSKHEKLLQIEQSRQASKDMQIIQFNEIVTGKLLEQQRERNAVNDFQSNSNNFNLKLNSNNMQKNEVSSYSQNNQANKVSEKMHIKSQNQSNIQNQTSEQITEQKYQQANKNQGYLSNVGTGMTFGQYTFQTIQTHDMNQEVKVYFDQRPPTSPNTNKNMQNSLFRGPISPLKINKLGQIAQQSDFQSYSRKIVYSQTGQSRSIKNQDNESKGGHLSQYKDQNYYSQQHSIQYAKNNKLLSMNKIGGGLEIRTIVPNTQMKKSLSTLTLQSKDKPKLIRNASQTANIFMKQRNKAKQQKFYFESQAIREAQKLEQPHYI
eukprot:403366174